MTIEFPCPHCTQLVRTPDSVAGKKGKCPGCNGIVQIPAANAVRQPVAAGSSSASKPTAAAAPSSAPAKPAPTADTIEFFCSSCGQVVRTPRSVAGKKGKCPHCSEVISIPMIGNPAAAAKTAAAAKSVAAAPPATTAAPTGKEERKRLAVESAKESTKPKPVKDLNPVKQVSKPAEPASPELKPIAPVVVPVAAEVAAALQASALAAKNAEYFGAADPFATLHQHAAPGLVKVAPSAKQNPLPQQVPFSAPRPAPVATPLPAALPPPSAPFTAPANPPAAVFTPLSPLKPIPSVPSPQQFSPLTPIGPVAGGNSIAGNVPADLFSDLPQPGGLAPVAAISPARMIMTAIHIPAIIQLCVVIPTLLAYLLYFGICVVHGGFAAVGMLAQGQFQLLASPTFFSSLIYGTLTLLLMIVQGVVIMGAIRQLGRRSLLLVQVSNFLALIPCVSPMGFPSAVWSLVGLYQDEVKNSFR